MKVQPMNKLPQNDPEKKDPQTPKPKVSDLYEIPSVSLKGIYEFIQLIGSGGAGIIYKAKQIKLDRIVAIKMIHSHLASPKSLKRFKIEAKTISSLVHPNIISVHDFGVTDEEQPYMVMDFIEGKTLSQYIKENERLSLEETIDFATQLCDGLSHAHARGILHRDFKSNNIMLVPLETGQFNLKILDFGLVKVVDQDDTEDEEDNLTKTGETIGTPAFMSPEQVMGKGVDHRSDIYSVGCVLYHCLTGKPPFLGDTKMETMLMHLNKEPIPVNERLGENVLDPAFDSILMKTLAKDKNDRFNSLLELKDSITASQKGIFTGFPQEQIVGIKTSDSKKLEQTTTLTAKNKTLLASLLIMIMIAIPLYFMISNLMKPVNQVPSIPPVEDAHTQVIHIGDDIEPDADFRGIIDRNFKKSIIRSDKLKISNDVLRYLKKVPNLKELYLDHSPISDEGLANLIPRTGLQILSLSDTNVKDEGLDSLRQLPNLRVLILKNTEITDKGLIYLGKINNLEILDLSNTNITSAKLGQLGNLEKLATLKLDETQVSDENFELLARAENLTELSLAKTNITDLGAKNISKIKSLRRLFLQNTKLSGKALDYLATLPYLATLDLSNTSIDDSCLPSLKKLNGLSILKLKNCKITQATINQYLRVADQCRVHKEP